MKPESLAILTALVVMSEISLAQTPSERPQSSAQPGPAAVQEKRCGHCNRVVPSSAKPGETCPFCGVQWVGEGSKSDESTGTFKQTAKSFSQKTRTPAGARGSLDTNQFEMTAAKYAIVFAGLAVGALIVSLTIRFLINNM
jgi:hypothetical protein